MVMIVFTWGLSQLNWLDRPLVAACHIMRVATANSNALMMMLLHITCQGIGKSEMMYTVTSHI